MEALLPADLSGILFLDYFFNITPGTHFVLVVCAQSPKQLQSGRKGAQVLIGHAVLLLDA